MCAPISWITKNPVGEGLEPLFLVADHKSSYALLLFLALNVSTTIGTFVVITLAMPPAAFGLPVLGLVSFFSLRHCSLRAKYNDDINVVVVDHHNNVLDHGI
ncbi:hypothetical protein B0H15DRAFT_835295 [Mycena belliarum]|uniref:Uncharacterized protein n=1 Tax=Mycena belliarum TaxID=1033014 RepID=A0AAD6XQJ1_9AGAR|nr:hypothetical protein B0H15DRAFT_835295 [Mycena belliae]